MQDMPFPYQHRVVDSLMSLFSYKHFSEGQMFAGEGPQKVEKEACVMQNLPSESQRSRVTSVGRDLPWTLSPKREAVATEVKERTTELCYPETRGSL